MDTEFFHDKIRGCWFGKCLAGAVGMPFEGVPYTVNITEEDICIQDVPNDDLELQLVWMDALKTHGINLNCEKLAPVWKDKIKHGCDEYSIAIHNINNGILPPASGWYDNFFASGMGATIRSEIWALIFPERPDAAAYFAQQDAEVDHWGDGVRGEIFMAMAEAHACIHSNIEAALRYAFERMDKDCRLYRTLAKVFDMFDRQVSDEEATRDLLLNEQRHHNFTDCVMNLSIIVHSLLRGGGDFNKTVLSAIAFGRDTDCTAASCGAFLGIAKGMKVFPEKWLDKVKNELTVSDFVSAIPGVPLTLDDLVNQTIELHNKLAKELPAEEYPAYVPYAPSGDVPKLNHSRWLILDGARFDIPAVKAALLEHGKCPEELKKHVAEFDTMFMDLSPFSDNYNMLHLFTFLEVEHEGTAPEDVVISATADVGNRLWLDSRRLMNHHSRQKMLPSFHRAEGGGAFALPLAKGERHLLHWELFSCGKPLNACLMFGNIFNDHLDGFNLNMETALPKLDRPSDDARKALPTERFR